MGKIWVEEKNKWFVNPYHFVSIDVPCVKQKSKKMDVPLSGRIHCKLTTRSPLFISGVDDQPEKNDEHHTFRFFSYDADNINPPTPVIPGSSIRGTVRSAYEVVTNSCLSTTKDTPLTSRTTDIRKPGLLKYENGRWMLHTADCYLVKITECNYDPKNEKCNILYDSLKNQSYISVDNVKKFTGDVLSFTQGQEVIKRKGREIKLGTGVKCLGKGDQSGVLVLGEYSSRKHYARIFTHQERGHIYEIENAERQWKAQLTLYADEKNNKHMKGNTPSTSHHGYVGLELKKDRDNPVWYLEVEGGGKKLFYLAPAAISRNIYHSTVEGILKNQGSHDHCTTAEQLCPACQLFGMVGEEDAVASRIRFTDAVLDDGNTKENCYQKETPLKMLGNPHLSCAEFYLKKPNSSVATWNFDYVTVKKNRKLETILMEKDSARFRGRKFYWHSTSNIADPQCSKFNRTVRPIRKDVSFHFDVYFHKISREELERLLWVLTIGDNREQSDFCHKMGYGKPIGMGSVKITVTGLYLRSLAVIREYQKKPFGENPPVNVREFLKMSDIHATDSNNVSYPIGQASRNKEESTASYQWFVGSRRLPEKGSTGAAPVLTELPSLNADDKSLPRLHPVKED